MEAETIVHKEIEVIMTKSQSESSGVMKNSIEMAVKKAMDEIIERRAFNVTENRAEKHDRYNKTEMDYRSILDKLNNDLCKECHPLLYNLDESVNAVVAFWQEQAYLQGLEDSSTIHQEFKKYGL